MSDDATNMILKAVGQLGERMELRLDRAELALHQINVCLATIETAVGSWVASTGVLNERINTIDVRVKLIGRHLDLREAGE